MSKKPFRQGLAFFFVFRILTIEYKLYLKNNLYYIMEPVASTLRVLLLASHYT